MPGKQNETTEEQEGEEAEPLVAKEGVPAGDGATWAVELQTASAGMLRLRVVFGPRCFSVGASAPLVPTRPRRAAGGPAVKQEVNQPGTVEPELTEAGNNTEEDETMNLTPCSPEEARAHRHWQEPPENPQEIGEYRKALGSTLEGLERQITCSQELKMDASQVQGLRHECAVVLHQLMYSRAASARTAKQFNFANRAKRRRSLSVACAVASYHALAEHTSGRTTTKYANHANSAWSYTVLGLSGFESGFLHARVVSEYAAFAAGERPAGANSTPPAPAAGAKSEERQELTVEEQLAKEQALRQQEERAAQEQRERDAEREAEEKRAREAEREAQEQRDREQKEGGLRSLFCSMSYKYFAPLLAMLDRLGQPRPLRLLSALVFAILLSKPFPLKKLALEDSWSALEGNSGTFQPWFRLGAAAAWPFGRRCAASAAREVRKAAAPAEQPWAGGTLGLPGARGAQEATLRAGAEAADEARAEAARASPASGRRGAPRYGQVTLKTIYLPNGVVFLVLLVAGGRFFHQQHVRFEEPSLYKDEVRQLVTLAKKANVDEAADKYWKQYDIIVELETPAHAVLKRAQQFPDGGGAARGLGGGARPPAAGSKREQRLEKQVQELTKRVAAQLELAIAARKSESASAAKAILEENFRGVRAHIEARKPGLTQHNNAGHRLNRCKARLAKVESEVTDITKRLDEMQKEKMESVQKRDNMQKELLDGNAEIKAMVDSEPFKEFAKLFRLHVTSGAQRPETPVAPPEGAAGARVGQPVPTGDDEFDDMLVDEQAADDFCEKHKGDTRAILEESVIESLVSVAADLHSVFTQAVWSAVTRPSHAQFSVKDLCAMWREVKGEDLTRSGTASTSVSIRIGQANWRADLEAKKAIGLHAHPSEAEAKQLDWTIDQMRKCARLMDDNTSALSLDAKVSLREWLSFWSLPPITDTSWRAPSLAAFAAVAKFCLGCAEGFILCAALQSPVLNLKNSQGRILGDGRHVLEAASAGHVLKVSKGVDALHSKFANQVKVEFIRRAWSTPRRQSVQEFRGTLAPGLVGMFKYVIWENDFGESVRLTFGQSPIKGMLFRAMLGVTPVEKVLTLLDDLKANIEQEGTAESQEYDRFACFCKDATGGRSSSILERKDESDILSASIAEDTASKATKAQELAERKAKHEEMEAELAFTKDQLAKDTAQYNYNAADLSKAISSLSNAMTALHDAKTPPGAAVLLALRSSVAKGSQLARALDSRLPKAQAFLQAKVDPTSPEYKYHSDGIISTIEDLHTEFTAKKATLDADFTSAKEAAEAKIAALEGDLSNNDAAMSGLETAISTLSLNLAAHKEGMIMVEAILKDDKLYLKDLTERCEARAHDWDQRSQMRADELSAITEARAIIAGRVQGMDEAVNIRALVQSGQAAKRPAAKAAVVPPSFVQSAAVRAHDHQAAANAANATELSQAQRDSTVELLAKEGIRLKSQPISMLAMKLAGDPFAKVKDLIQGLIERLLKESIGEATKEGFCNEELGKAEKDRDFRYQEVKTLNVEVASLELKKDELESEIQELTDSIAGLWNDLNTSTEPAVAFLTRSSIRLPGRLLTPRRPASWKEPAVMTQNGMDPTLPSNEQMTKVSMWFSTALRHSPYYKDKHNRYFEKVSTFDPNDGWVVVDDLLTNWTENDQYKHYREMHEVLIKGTDDSVAQADEWRCVFVCCIKRRSRSAADLALDYERDCVVHGTSMPGGKKKEPTNAAREFLAQHRGQEVIESSNSEAAVDPAAAAVAERSAGRSSAAGPAEPPPSLPASRNQRSHPDEYLQTYGKQHGSGTKCGLCGEKIGREPRCRRDPDAPSAAEAARSAARAATATVEFLKNDPGFKAGGAALNTVNGLSALLQSLLWQLHNILQGIQALGNAQKTLDEMAARILSALEQPTQGGFENETTQWEVLHEF
ncbi:unnamed protein product [Prorocentrum cordatum]|uniref:Uncharacterized protein n=1 Tax=Prorocentrum cordatum TaxID=2364126 RepID=A0ABN9UEB1_9DINO|nr:unnamed protein product [Polarella glacialis]